MGENIYKNDKSWPQWKKPSSEVVNKYCFSVSRRSSPHLAFSLTASVLCVWEHSFFSFLSVFSSSDGGRVQVFSRTVCFFTVVLHWELLHWLCCLLYGLTVFFALPFPQFVSLGLMLLSLLLERLAHFLVSEPVQFLTGLVTVYHLVSKSVCLT